MKNLILLIVALTSMWLFLNREQSPAKTDIVVDIATTTSKFACDGRQRCSEMNSLNEAKFFVENCPDIKIEVKESGIPCNKHFK